MLSELYIVHFNQYMHVGVVIMELLKKTNS